MALKNKDGTVFRLSSPNELVKEQKWLDSENLIFHNFSWQAILVPDNKGIMPRTITRQEKIIIPQSCPPPIKLEVKQEPSNSIVEQFAVPELVSEQDSESSASELKPVERSAEVVQEIELPENTIIMHCLPLIGWKKKQDKLYGDSYKVPSYGEKSTLEAIIVERADLAISIWISESLKSKEGQINTIDYLQPGSIIYPEKYIDGSKLGDRRWWKVERVTPLDQGVLVVAVATDSQPSFAS